MRCIVTPAGPGIPFRLERRVNRCACVRMNGQRLAESRQESPSRAEPPEAASVVVVGAGIIGMSLAFELARRSVDVVVLERSRPGAGAAGVAAGMLAPMSEA